MIVLFADKNSKTISIQKSEIIIYEVGSKVNRNNDKITGYHWLKRITIDVMIFLLKDVIPVFPF